MPTAASLLGNAGIKGSDAGTALKQSLLQLTAPSDKAKGLMKALAEDIGVAGDIAYDAAGNMRSFPEILGLVSESTKTLSEEQRNYIVSTIFGADAARAILVLMQQGPDAWDKMTDAVTRQGAAQDLAAAQTKGWNGALEGAKSQVETLQLTIGQALTPILADLFNNYVSPGIATITAFAESILAADDPMRALVDSIDRFSPILGTVVAAIADFVSSGGDLGVVADDLNEGMDGLGDAFLVVTDIAKLVIGGVRDVVAWFNTASDTSSDLGGAVDDLNGVWTKAQDVVGNVMDAYMHIAQAVLPIVTRFVDEHGEEIEAFFKTTWASVIEIVNLALDTYNAIVPPILNAIAGFIDEHGSEITKILSGAWTLITSIITGTLETIKGVFKVTLALLRGDWEGAWTGIKGIADAQVKAIEGAITGFLNMIAGLFDTTLDDIIGMWEDNWNMAVDIVSKIDWGQVGADVVSGIISGVRGASDGLMRTLRNLASDALQAAKDALGISSPSKAFMAVGEFAVQGIMEGFSNTWPALTGMIGSISADLIDDMKSIGRDMQDAIADSFGATASMDRQMAKNFDRLGNIGSTFLQDYIQQSLAAEQKVAETFTDPAAGASYFKMVSDNIFETAALQKKIDESTDDREKERLKAQLILISRAQDAEMEQFRANQAGKQSATEQMADSINAVMAALAGINLTDDQIQIVGLLSSIWGQLQTPIQTASPPASAPQMAAQTNTTNYYGPVGPQMNMPVYTNNTPGAIQQSWAVMQASMP